MLNVSNIVFDYVGLAACRGAGIDCAAVGRVVPESEGVTLASGGIARPMPCFVQDEITKVFSGS